MTSLVRKHIADPANANSTIQEHWGYVQRILPCTNDAGSCEYLDAVYWMHDISMLYTFILWAVIGFVLVLISMLKFLRPKQDMNQVSNQQTKKPSSAYQRGFSSAQSFIRRWLLPESFLNIFGHVTRLQVLTLAILLAYLLIFSLVGIVYKTWITPVKKTTLFNTRTGLGGFSDRIGALAYALTPLTVALATRESLLTLITGIPYQSFNFLHRWLGRVIFVQSFLHTLGWTLIEGRFYQPQPTTYRNFIKEPYIIWGCVAMMFITFLFIFSLQSVIRWTGHEFFRKAHYVVAALYIGSCWAHWDHLVCWMIASLGLWGLDRGVRFLRTGLIHIGYLDGSKGFGFHPAQSAVQFFDDEDGGVIRLDFAHNHEAWAVGQHFFLTFPALTIWQSHPFTVASVPNPHPELPHHTYIIRCRKGETGRLKSLANLESQNATKPTTPVILCGPYGTPLLSSISPEITNILAIAGGTGISLTLPLVLATTASPWFAGATVDFVWIIRRASNIQWISNELSELKQRASQGNLDLRIHIFITQEDTEEKGAGIINSDEKEMTIEATKGSSSTSEGSVSSLEKCEQQRNYKLTYLKAQRPSLHDIVTDFLSSRASSLHRTRVVASGPASMGHDLRAAVAISNDGSKVWKDDRKFDVSLEWDDRMG